MTSPMAIDPAGITTVSSTQMPSVTCILKLLPTRLASEATVSMNRSDTRVLACRTRVRAGTVAGASAASGSGVAAGAAAGTAGPSAGATAQNGAAKTIDSNSMTESIQD